MKIHCFFILLFISLGAFLGGCQKENTINPKKADADLESSHQPPSVDLIPPPELGERRIGSHWQLLTTPVDSSMTPANFLASNALESIVKRIFTWNSNTSTWKIYPYEASYTEYEPLEVIEPNRAYWFQVSEPVYFPNKGAIQREFTFHNGWNLVGFSSGNSPVDIDAFFTDGANGSILSRIVSVWQWDLDHWQVWSPNWSEEQITNFGFDSLTAIAPGKGFWVNYDGMANASHTYQPGAQTAKAFFGEIRSLGLSLGDFSEELKAGGSLKTYSELAQQFEQELQDLPYLKTVSARFATALKTTRERIVLNASNNLVIPDNLQDFSVMVEGESMYLDASYTSDAANNIIVSWQLKSEIGQNIDVDQGNYSVSGEMPRQKGVVDFEASVMGYSLESERIDYDLGEAILHDQTQQARETDLRLDLENFMLQTTVSGEIYRMEWKTGEIVVHYKTEMVDGIETVSDSDSHVSRILLTGSLQTPRAKLEGRFDFSNTSNSVFASIPYLKQSGRDYDNVYTLKMHTIDLFDFVMFTGQFMDLQGGEAINLGLSITMAPNQHAMLPIRVDTVLHTRYGVTINCEGNTFRMSKAGDTATCLKGTVLLERFAEDTVDYSWGYYYNGSYYNYDVYYEIAPFVRMTSIEKPDNYFKARVALTGNVASFLSSQYQGYRFSVSLARDGYRSGNVALSFLSTDMSLSFSGAAEIEADTHKLVTTSGVKLGFTSPTLHFDALVSADNTTGHIVFQNEWLRMSLDGNLDDQNTRDVGTLENLAGDEIAEVEYNRDLGLRAKYEDGSFETLAVVPPRLLEDSLAIEGPDTIEILSYGSAQYRATGTYSDGRVRTVNADWEVVGDTSVSMVAGYLRASMVLSDTPLTITAKFKGQIVQKVVIATPVPPNNISIEGSENLVEGHSYNYYLLIGHDGYNQYLSRDVPWKVSNPDVVSVDSWGNLSITGSISAATEVVLSVDYGGVVAEKTITIHPAFTLSISGPDELYENTNAPFLLKYKEYNGYYEYPRSAEAWNVDKSELATIETEETTYNYTKGSFSSLSTDTETTVTLLATYQGKTVSKTVTILPTFSNFSGEARDIVVDEPRNSFYFSDYDGKRLIAVDTKSGDMRSLMEFDHHPERLRISPDGKKLYVALIVVLSGQASATDGYVAEIDLDSETRTKLIQMPKYPGDLVVTSSGKLVVLAKNGWFDGLRLYDLVTETLLDSQGFSTSSPFLALHSNDKWIYAASANSKYLTKYDISMGQLTSVFSKYLEKNLYAGAYLSPEGDLAVSGGGDRFQTAETEAEDFTYLGELTEAIVEHATFDEGNRLIFTVEAVDTNATSYPPTYEYYLRYYHRSSLLKFGEIALAATKNLVALANDSVFSVQMKNGTTHILKHAHPCSDCGDSTAPVAHFSISPEAGGTQADEYLLSAEDSSDEQSALAELRFRWDWNSDGVYDTEFSSDSQIAHRFDFAGSKEITLQVVDPSGLVDTKTLDLDVGRNAIEGENQAVFGFEFAIGDLELDAIRNRLFVSHPGAKRLLVVNASTGLTERQIDFEAIPDQLVFSPDQSKLYLSLTTENETYSEAKSVGFVQEYDLASLTKTREIELQARPYSFVVTSSGKVVVSGTSGSSGYLQDYDMATGTLGTTLYAGTGMLQLHPNERWIYFRGNHSPEKYDIGGTGISFIGYAPSNGYNRSLYNFKVSPDGSFLVSSHYAGVFHSSADVQLDMVHREDLDGSQSFINLVFDEINNVIFATHDYYNYNSGSRHQAIAYYNIDSLLKIGEVLVAHKGDRVLLNNERIFTMQTVDGQTKIFEHEHPCLDCEKGTVPTALFSVTPASGGTIDEEFVFDASASSDMEDNLSSLVFRWDWDSDGDYDTEFSSSPQATQKYYYAGGKVVTLQVRDSTGLQDTHTVTVNVAKSENAEENDPEFGFQYSVSETLVDHTRNRLYTRGKGLKRVDATDLTTGTLQHSFFLEYTPISLALSPDGSMLYIAQSTGIKSYVESSSAPGVVTVFESDSMIKQREFDLRISPYDLVVTSSSEAVVSGSSGYDKKVQRYGSNGAFLGSALHSDPTNLWLHPDEKRVYAEYYSSKIWVLDISGAGIETLYLKNNWDGPDVMTPDGTKMISLQRGKYYSVSDDEATDLTELGNFNEVYYSSEFFFDIPNNLLFTQEHRMSYTFPILSYYDFTSMAKLGEVSLQDRYDDIFYHGEQIFLLEADHYSDYSRIFTISHPCPNCGAD